MMKKPARQSPKAPAIKPSLPERKTDPEESPGRAQRRRQATQADAQRRASTAAPATTQSPARRGRRPAARRFSSVTDLQVVVLHSQALGLERGRPEDRIADEETELVARDIVQALQGRVKAVYRVPVWDDLEAALRRFDPCEHVVFNLVESLAGRAFTEPETPHYLRARGFAHTGGSARCLERTASKLTTKRLVAEAGLATPSYQVFRRRGQHEFTVPLPAIVKPVGEGGSFGVTQDSLVRTRDSLAARIDYCLETYRQPVLVEQFIIGRELNVALWGNREPSVLPISEIRFTWTQDPLQQIVTFDSKWIPESAEYSGTPGVCPAPLSAEVEDRVRSTALLAYKALSVRGYARVDIRLGDGIPYVLEINVNPDLARDAGFFRSARTAGYSYADMILRILELAIAAYP
jgi:D-alanine-D-alanine ligase